MILLDSNVLGRITDSTDPQCPAARRATQILLFRPERLVIVPQNLFEFWAVATRIAGKPPAGQSGLGMTIEQASQWIGFFQRRFHLLSDNESLISVWHDLVKSHRVKGLQSYDARLVAAMQTNGIKQILTFNLDHFKKYPVTALDPASF